MGRPKERGEAEGRRMRRRRDQLRARSDVTIARRGRRSYAERRDHLFYVPSALDAECSASDDETE